MRIQIICILSNLVSGAHGSGGSSCTTDECKKTLIAVFSKAAAIQKMSEVLFLVKLYIIRKSKSN